MDETTLERLNAAPWKDLTVSLLQYATCRISTWPSTCGFTAEDIVHAAIEKIYSGERNWDPAKASLEEYLKWVIHSLISSHGVVRRREHDMIEYRDPSDHFLVSAGADGDELDAIRSAAFDILKQEVAHDKGLSDIVAGAEIGDSSVAEAAASTGYSTKQVYELNRKLKPFMERTLARLRQEGTVGEARHAT